MFLVLVVAQQQHTLYIVLTRMQAPTDPPSAGPVGLWVNFFMPGSWVMPHARTEHKKALAAIDDGTDVLLKGRGWDARQQWLVVAAGTNLFLC